MISVLDDRGVAHHWETPPQRLVSLVPSDTYTLLRLGFGSRIVGRTRYCVEPAADVAEIAVVGGAKDPDVERILALRPDLVVANREDNRRADVCALEARGVRVWVSYPRTVEQGLEHAVRLAQLLPEPGARAKRALDAGRAVLEAHAARGGPQVPTLVPIWLDPLMAAGPDTVTSDVLGLAGGRNVLVRRSVAGRYPRMTLAEAAALRPALVLLPDEPYPFTRAHRAVFDELGARVELCDGRTLTWYGLRCLAGLEELSEQIGPANRT